MISDVQHAITYLGFNQVYQLVVDREAKSTMPDTPEFQELQFHSNVVSFFSFELARLCGRNKPLLHCTIGLLHDIGK
ncbi:MAG: HDOD domain-containing protein [Planctomycetes bacterium]|nr:HDOD domain-containing protein [Planctomycetota bacterium]